VSRAPRAAALRARALGLDRLSMFVPAVMGLGLVAWLVSQVIGVAQVHTTAARERQAATSATAVVDALHGRPSTATPPRPRLTYLAVGAGLLAIAVYLAIGASANYFSPDGYVHGIAWLWTTALFVIALATVYGAAALAAFASWPVSPRWAARLLARTPLGTHGAAPGHSADHPPGSLSASVLLAAALAAFVVLFVVSSPELADQADRWVADSVAGSDPLAELATLDPASNTAVLAGLCLVAALAAARCRVLAVSIVASSAIGLLVVLALRPIVGHARPAAGPSAGELDSLPSVQAVVGVLVAGLFPLAVGVLLHRDWARWSAGLAFSTIVLGTFVAAGASHDLATGVHWPSDVAAGALIGLTLVLATEWMVRNRAYHRNCHHCPWSIPDQEVRGAIRIHPSLHGWLKIAASASTAAATLVVTWLAIEVDLPIDTGGVALSRSVEVGVELALAALLLVASLISWRWPAIAAVVVTFAASAAGVYASVQLRPAAAVTLFGLFWVPAALLWLSWQHRRRPPELVAVAVCTAVLLGATWAGAASVYDHYYGPSHPASDEPVLPLDRVEWVWSGGLRHDGVVVTARLVSGAEASLELTDEHGSVRRTPPVAADGNQLVRLTVDDLDPATTYGYQVVVDGRADTGRGTGGFRTPSDGAMSFTFTAGACAVTGSNGAVFDAIRRTEPLLHLAVGDLHYADIDSNSVPAHLSAFDAVLTSASQSALARAVPQAYVWDDHDYGPNDADAESPGRPAARYAYRAAVPHGPMLDGDAPIQQAFTIGRVRFVMTDLRSERTATSMLGDDQRRWLLDELRTSSRTHALVVWVSSVPWIAAVNPGGDTWGGYPDERAEIAEVIATEGIRNLLMVAGDAHMVALDDGTNSNYSTLPGPGFPVFHVAALDRPGSVKGGPYSEGTHPGAGRYGRVDVRDEGGPTIGVQLTGLTWDGEVLVEHAFTFPVGRDA
jgi:hypothetical protein